MIECPVCGDNNYDEVDGYFFCSTCQTQSQNIRQEETSDFINTRGLALSIGRLRDAVPTTKRKQAASGRPWETVEACQIILRKQVDALIKQGVNPRLKDVVFKLWCLYLSFTGNGFNNQEENTLVLKKLADIHPRDRDINPGTVEEPKVKAVRINHTLRQTKKHVGTRADLERRQLEETLRDEEYYEGDNPLAPDDDEIEARKILDEAYNEGEVRGTKFGVGKKNPYSQVSRLSLKVLVSFLHLGLLYCHNTVTVADLYQWMEKDIVPYRKSSTLLPEDMKFNAYDANMYTSAAIPTPDTIRQKTGMLIKFLCMSNFPLIDLRVLVSRYVVQLSLPVELHGLLNLLLKKTGPMMNVSRTTEAFQCVLPEHVAMAHIVIVLKMLFVLDDKHENKISEYAHAVNAACPDLQLFDWSDWVWYKTTVCESLDQLPRNVSEVLRVKDLTKCLNNHKEKLKMRHSESRGRYDSFLRSEVRGHLDQPMRALSEGLPSKTSATIDWHPSTIGSNNKATGQTNNSQESAHLNATLDLDFSDVDTEPDADENLGRFSEEELFRQASVKFITHGPAFTQYIKKRCSIEPFIVQVDKEKETTESRENVNGTGMLNPETLRELLDLPHAGCSPYHLHVGRTPWSNSYRTCLNICSKVISCSSEDLHLWTKRLESTIFKRMFTETQYDLNKMFYSKYLSRLVKA